MGGSEKVEGGGPFLDERGDLLGEVRHTGGGNGDTPKEAEEGLAQILTENAETVLRRRYLKKNEDGVVVETPEEMWRRVARAVACADLLFRGDAPVQEIEERFYAMLSQLEFLPNSPTLMNAGKELGQLSACFVLPVDDSMESIFEAIKNAALVHKSGGGTGFGFSRIRPKNDMVHSTKGISSGPLSFLNVFDAATETVKQGGTRRGANMAILRVDHPDILDFITAKKEGTKLTNFNISVAVTDDFMSAVRGSRDYNLLNPRNGEVAGTLSAKKVFDLMTTLAWKNGDPGIVFLDRINRDNPTPQLGAIESTNPCGEQPLLPYESCNLGSVNLVRMLKKSGDGYEVDFDRLSRTVSTAIHFLDNVIEVNKYPLPEIEEMTKGNRKVGLGVMGFADMLILLGIPYDSEEAILVAEEVMRFVNEVAREKSRRLTEERGPFPNFAGSVYEMRREPAIRNATRTTIAPTGTLSIIANCSSGIEPLYALVYYRNVLDNDKLLEVNSSLRHVAERRGFLTEEFLAALGETGSLRDIPGVPEDVKRLFVTAHDVTPEWHVRMQAAFQKHTDNAVSKTVNFPHEATVEDVKKVYMYAFEMGCKGVTIYRDGSRDVQVLNKGLVKETERDGSKRKTQVPTVAKRERPKRLRGETIQMETGCGFLYVTINEDERGIFELFNTMGKAGGCAASQSEAIGRLVSLAWRSGIDAGSVVKQLIGIRCHKPIGIGESTILSCSDAIAKAIQLHLSSEIPKYSYQLEGGTCPECGSPLEQESGCAFCRNCAYSECY
jgi:ribonucleoside-diphosphate reductase alpha chain